MINYRHIFNPNYNYIGLILIIFLIILIFLNNRSTKQSIQQIGIIMTFSGMITLIIAFLLNFVIEVAFPRNYQLFVEVISNNVSKNCWSTSLITVFFGGTLLIADKIFFQDKKIAN